jgi:hypothetical protein
MLCIGYATSASDEGIRSRREPLTRLRFAKPPSPTTGEGEELSRLNERYGVMEIGEKSTNQLFGCTNPWILGLMARGATSWAT